MRKFRYLIIAVCVYLSAAFFIAGCERKNSEVKIALSPWVGYTPLAYAESKGWLAGSDIELLWTVGLSESVSLYESGRCSGFAATQYEYLKIKQRDDLKALFLINKSNGADAILSNKSLDELKSIKPKEGVVYLEVDSLNNDLLDAFLKEKNIPKDGFEKRYSEQNEAVLIKPNSRPTLIISYEPYKSAIEKNGFFVVSSTKDLKSIEIIDALFVQDRAIKTHSAEFKKLERMYGDALKALLSNPKEYYETIKGYLHGQTYNDFLKSLGEIEWLIGEQISKNSYNNALETLSSQSIDTTLLNR